ncbi:hypothetical protein FBEOM_367 [Fusarium beomiforme]|uniref:Uncharacterized protein n=1 Tax=Fusarium beomiforme TaxID=44412 RepID=A0A9P5AVU1_9HYPO|nr:hypothetical protein FBEOM_367 [Fusarium beomiforme]
MKTSFVAFVLALAAPLSMAAPFPHGGPGGFYPPSPPPSINGTQPGGPGGWLPVPGNGQQPGVPTPGPIPTPPPMIPVPPPSVPTPPAAPTGPVVAPTPTPLPGQ